MMREATAGVLTRPHLFVPFLHQPDLCADCNGNKGALFHVTPEPALTLTKQQRELFYAIPPSLWSRCRWWFRWS